MKLIEFQERKNIQRSFLLYPILPDGHQISIYPEDSSCLIFFSSHFIFLKVDFVLIIIMNLNRIWATLLKVHMKI